MSSFLSKFCQTARLHSLRFASVATNTNSLTQRFSSPTLRITSVQLKEKELSIQWNNSSTVDLPYVFLRDNCQEPESFDQVARQRLFNPAFTVDLNIRATDAQVNEGGKQLTITWPDGHHSRYKSTWLGRHCIGNTAMSGRLPVETVYWGGDYYDKMPRFDYEMLLEDDRCLLECLLKVESHGLVLIENVGTQLNQVKRFCDRIYYPKPCIYGKGVMKVENKPNASHISLTGVELPLHNDFVYYDYTSGLHILHFIHQVSDPTAGASQFCDGFHVAEVLRERNRAAFDLLSQYPVQFVDAGCDVLGDYDTEAWHNTISVSSNGEITEVNYSNHSRGPHIPSTLMDKLYEWYAAYYELSHLLYLPDYMIEFKIQPGQMVMLNNRRVLHGRSAFKVQGNEYRYGEICYMDWDEIRSKARVLMKKLSLTL